MLSTTTKPNLYKLVWGQPLNSPLHLEIKSFVSANERFSKAWDYVVSRRGCRLHTPCCPLHSTAYGQPVFLGWPAVPSALYVKAGLSYSFYSTTGKESLIWIAPPSSLSHTQIPCLGGMTASPVLLLHIKYKKYGSKKPDRQKADLERQNKENTCIFTKASKDKRRQRNHLWVYWGAGKSGGIFSSFFTFEI